MMGRAGDVATGAGVDTSVSGKSGGGADATTLVLGGALVAAGGAALANSQALNTQLEEVESNEDEYPMCS